MKIRLPGVDADTNDVVNGLLDLLRQKTRRNLLRASYYDGKHAVAQIGNGVIPPHYYRLGIVLGWTAKTVDLLARRCNVDGMVWPDGDVQSLGIDELWETNRLDSEIRQAITSTLIHTPSYAVSTTGMDGEPTGLLHFRDAMSAVGTWNPRLRRLDAMLSVTARDEDGEPAALALYLPGRTVVAAKDPSGWSVEEHTHGWGMPAEPLVYRPRLGRWAGSSRITRSIMALQDIATRAVIRMEGHMDAYSWPELWLFGPDMSILRNEDGTPRASWEVMLGRIKGVPDSEDALESRADVKQIGASSPEPHLAQLNAAAKMLAREASLPDSALALKDMANPTSAESYQASREDLVSEAEGTMDDLAPGLRRATLRSLAMQNGLSEVPEQWKTIGLKLRNPMYVSRAQAADAGSKQLGSAPWLAETEVGLELLGLSDQQIARALGERRRAQARLAVERLAAAASAASEDPEVAELAGRRGIG